MLPTVYGPIEVTDLTTDNRAINTVNVAVSHCVWFGAGAHTWYTTVHGFGVASYVTTLPVNDGFAQVPPVSVNVLPGGTWSLPPRSNVFPVEPPGALVVSSTASTIGGVAVVLLFPPVVVPPLLSLVAPVVPVNVTLVGPVSLPPAVPGAV